MIVFDNVSKIFRARDGLRTVLRDVSVSFDPDRNYGILGTNGAGKSTLLRLISGASAPTSGRIRRSGRISWPLGFSGGIHGQLSGRENAEFVARIYGENVRRVQAFVADFAELGRYFDMPAETYSSGMRARLAFGLSMAIDFDCYLVDELTAVGDARFNEKCANAFARRRERSRVIMVSHQMATIRRFCDAGAVLDNGRLTLYDSLDQAAMAYQAVLTAPRVSPGSRR
jgi:capsular polysaccharide transport system ATP-binding protein